MSCHDEEAPFGWPEQFYGEGPVPQIKQPIADHPDAVVFLENFDELKAFKSRISDCVGLEFYLNSPGDAPYKHTVLYTLSYEDAGQGSCNAALALFGDTMPAFPVNVVFLLGKFELATSAAKISMGDSTSVAGVDWSRGTLGGVVLMNDVRYLLTCRHVTHPVNYCNNRTYSGQMVSPSEGDHQRILQRARRTMDSDKNDWNRIRNQTPPNQYAGAIERAANKSTRHHQNLQSMNRIVSNVPYAPETREEFVDGANRTFDWALVRLQDTNRFSKYNQVKTNQELTATHLRMLDYVDVIRFKDMEDMQTGEYVFKRGNKTGLTEGEIGTIRNDVDMGHTGTSTTEYTVVEDGFSQQGDSGAWVVDDSHNVVGMIIGGQYITKPYRTYISNMRLIFDDIFQKTGIMPQIPNPDAYISSSQFPEQ